MKKLQTTLLIFVSFLFFAITANAATFVVNTTNDTADATPGDGNCADAGGNCSLRAAISEANAFAGDDIITIPAGTYTQTLVAANEDLNAGGDWDITSNITINGAGSATTILQAAASAGTATERVLNIRPGATAVINNVTIRNGRFTGTMTASTRGAGIENNGSLTLNSVIVRDNQINSTSGNSIGAGIHNAGAVLTLTNSTITANSNVRVSGGSAFGGGISSIVAVNFTITNSSISGNSTNSQAGGFGFGSGMYLENLFNVTATNSNFDNNTGLGQSGSNGAGVRALSNIGAAVFNATNCTFSNNSGTTGPTNQGVGIQFFTTTAVAATLTATLDRVTIAGNVGNGNGVGVNVTVNGGNATINVNNSTISGNTGGANGGGMLVSNAGSTLTSPGTINFTNSTISGNTVSANGGGYAVEQPTVGVITTNFNFSTIARNIANADNSGTEVGGGIIRASGTVNLKNSIVADNTVGTGGSAPDISGTVNSQNYNHIKDLTGATITGTTTNNTTGDPLLGALAANGGPTNTHLPAAGSPVVNAIPNGTNDCGNPITTDQRGGTRPTSGACEKGSVELSAPAVQASISGRVLTAEGQGIANVSVTISGGNLPSPITVQTGSFGNYSFSGILTQQTYTITINSKRYTFSPSSRNITLNGDLTNENFISTNGF